jgi:hypothetical protein
MDAQSRFSRRASWTLPSQSPLQLVAALSTSRGDASGQWPGGTGGTASTGTARENILKTAVHGVSLQLSNQGGILGQNGETSSTAYSAYNWTTFDLRNAEAAASVGTNGDVTFLAYGAPLWMMIDGNGAGSTVPTNGTQMTSSTVQDMYVDSTQTGNTTGKGYAEFLEFAVIRALDAGVPVKNLVVWQELRGYFASSARAGNSYVPTGASANSWDIWRYAKLYNAIWDRFKNSTDSRVRAIQIGGPYTVSRAQLDSGVAAGGASTPATAFNGDSVNLSRTVGGVGAHIDGKILDANIRFSTICHGVNFWVCDAWMWQTTITDSAAATYPHRNVDMIPSTPWTAGTTNTVQHADGSVVFDDRDKLTLFGRWAEKYYPNIPKWCVEAYFGSNNSTTDFGILFDAAQAGGFQRIFPWLGPNYSIGVGSQLWDPATDTITAIGTAMQSKTSLYG